MDISEAAVLLAWYRAMGVDECIEAVSHDRFAQAAEPIAESAAAMEAGRARNGAAALSRENAAAATMDVASISDPATPLAPAEAGRRVAPGRVAAGASPFAQGRSGHPADPGTRGISADAADGPARRIAQSAPASAAEVAPQARNLAALRAEIADLPCALPRTAKHLVFARGAPDARLMVIGDAPGRDEDLSGIAAAGAAGQLLDSMLAAIGIGPHQAYITQLIFWRPPGGRVPNPAEIDMCLPYTLRHIALIRPAVVLLLGNLAARTLLNASQHSNARTDNAGHGSAEPAVAPLPEAANPPGCKRPAEAVIKVENTEFPAFPTLHLTRLLRDPLAKAAAWRDMLRVETALRAARDTR